MWQEQEQKDPKKLTFSNSTTGEVCKLSLIYEHKDLGSFYIFDNLSQMPFQRKYLFDVISQHEKLGATKDEISAAFTAIKDLLVKGERKDVMQAYSVAEFYSNKIKDWWNVLHSETMILSLVIMQRGESLAFITQEEMQDKINTWIKDKEMIGFFLRTVSARIDDLRQSFMSSLKSASANLQQQTQEVQQTIPLAALLKE